MAANDRVSRAVFAYAADLMRTVDARYGMPYRPRTEQEP